MPSIVNKQDTTEYRFKDKCVRAELKFIGPNGKIPSRKRRSDAAYDIYAAEDVSIHPSTMESVHTDICLAVPEGWYFTVEGRSGLYRMGIQPCHGIIDATYCGELVISLMNVSNKPYNVKIGDRIAQIIVHKQHHLDIDVVDEFSDEYNQRGTLGFGSSGR